MGNDLLALILYHLSRLLDSDLERLHIILMLVGDGTPAFHTYCLRVKDCVLLVGMTE